MMTPARALCPQIGRLLLAEQTPTGSFFHLVLLDLELAEQTLEREVNLMPLRFDIVDGVGHVTEVTQ